MKKILALIIFIILPLLFSCFVFWQGTSLPAEFLPQEEKKVSEIYINKEKIFRSGFKSLFRRIFQSTFELNNYELCMENISYSVIGEEKEFIPTTLNLLDKKSNSIYDLVWFEKNSKKCISVNPDVTVIRLTTNFEKNGVYTPDEGLKIAVTPDVKILEDSVSLTSQDKLATTVIFLIAWWAFVFLLFNVLKVFGIFILKI